MIVCVGRNELICLLCPCEHWLQEVVSFPTAMAYPLMAVSGDHWHTRYIALVKLKHLEIIQHSLNVLVFLCSPFLCLKGPWLRKGVEIDSHFNSHCIIPNTFSEGNRL